jgi:hypothetical protein
MTQRDIPRHEDEDRWAGIPSDSHAAKVSCEDEDPITLCVVEAVAEATETDPLNMQPLSEVIDPDSLERLFETPDPPQRGYVVFRFEGCDVTVSADEWVAVAPRTNDGE